MHFKSHYIHKLSAHRQLLWSSWLLFLYICRFLLYLEHKGQMISCTLSYLVRNYRICLVPLRKVVHTFLSILKRHLTYPELSERTMNLTERTLRPEMVEHPNIYLKWENGWIRNNLANILLAFLRKENYWKKKKTSTEHSLCWTNQLEIFKGQRGKIKCEPAV